MNPRKPLSKMISFFSSVTDKNQIQVTQKKRIQWVKNFFILCFVILSVRSTFLHLYPSSKQSLQNMAHSQYSSSLRVSSYRGNILDQRNAPLAISVKSPSIAMNPKAFRGSYKEIRKLRKILDIPAKKLNKLRKKDRYFVWLKRKISYKKAAKIKALQLTGVFQIFEPSRFYPEGTSASNLLGYVGMDNTGLLGIEHAYDKELRGEKIKTKRQRDGRGHTIYTSTASAAPQKPGHNIILTIDRVIQEITEESLGYWHKKSRAKEAFAIVMDPHTGKVLAMANRPHFNPNKATLRIKKTKNKAISEAFEPGSTVKPLVLAYALEKGKTTINEIHNCEKTGRFQVDKRSYIHDDHPHEFLTTAEVLSESSNICTYKIAERLGEKALYKGLLSFGVGKGGYRLGITGEQKGRLQSWQKWQKIRFANISFGQGLLVTGLELATAYSAFANGGYLVKPYLIQRVEDSKGRLVHPPPQVVKKKVLSFDVSQQMQKALKLCVDKGTCREARLTGYDSAGKTGTAEKFDPEEKQYAKNKRIANFAGFAPALDPHIVIYVVIDEPQEKPYYGGKWAAPVFREIAQKTLKYLNVPQTQEHRQLVDLKKKSPDYETSKQDRTSVF